MKASRKLRPFAGLLALLGSAALAAAPEAPAIGNSSLSLRLADGSLIRFPCDAAERQAAACASSTALQSASLSAGPRRAPLKRRTQVFDTRTPGVVASVRG